MPILDLLKSKKLPVGVFAGVKTAPGPARIMIDLTYTKDFSFLLQMNGFTTVPENATEKTCRIIKFDIPVTPPTIKIDFGNSKDTENVTRIGEVVLPKYQKAKQFRWESFFPYDLNAKYINTSVRNLSWGTLSQYKNTVSGFVSDAKQSVKDIFKNVVKPVATPETYIKIFETLAKTEKPFTIAMTFYSGGDIPETKVTLESFSTEPENNGDYKYEIALVEWTNIKPKKLDSSGNKTNDASDSKPDDSIKFKQINNLSDFWKWAKQCYATVSKPLLWAFATYNGARNLIFDGVLKAWKIKGSLQDLGGRFGILSNMFGMSKITSKDTQAVSNSLKQLSFTKASKQMAELLNQNKMYRS